MSPKINKINKSYISSFENLLSVLGISREQADEISDLNDHYTPIPIRKKDGSLRNVYAPSNQLKHIQRRFKDRVLASPNIISWPSYLYGSLKNTVNKDGVEQIRDYVACAAQHKGAKSLLVVDIQDFFDNIHKDLVADILNKYFSKNNETIEFLLKICCYENKLVQGAPTSSYLANMALYDVEPKIYKRLCRKNLTYTRFVDDMAVSSKVYDYDFSYVLRTIKESLYRKELFLNENKINIRYAGSEPLTVHGLRVDFHNPRLPPEEIRKIRAHVKMIENMAKVYKIRTSFSYRKEFSRCVGRVNKLKRTGHKKHCYFIERLRKVEPIPSRSEVEFCQRKLNQLLIEYPGKKIVFSIKRNIFGRWNESMC